MSLRNLPPVHVLSAASALNTAGGRDNGVAATYHTLFVVAGAGVSAGVVTLEVSQDNVNWTGVPTPVTVTTSAPGTSIAVTVACPVQYARARISTAITGGTIDAWIAASGD